MVTPAIADKDIVSFSDTGAAPASEVPVVTAYPRRTNRQQSLTEELYQMFRDGADSMSVGKANLAIKP